MEEIVENAKQENKEVDPAKRWEYVKYKIKEETIKYCKEKVRDRRKIRESIAAANTKVGG